jgi:hypothetical protein
MDLSDEFSIEDEVEYLRSKVENLTNENINMSLQLQRVKAQLEEKNALLNMACKIPTKRHRNSPKYRFYHEHKDSKEVLSIVEQRYNNIFTENKVPWQIVKQITDELFEKQFTIETSSSDS